MTNRRSIAAVASVLVVLGATLSAASAATTRASAATVISARIPTGACAQSLRLLYVKVTDGPTRPLPGTRVSIQAGTWIGPASGMTNAAGKVTLPVRPVPFRRGAYTIKITAAPPRRAQVTKLLPIKPC